MTTGFLEAPRQPLADAVRRYFKDSWGVGAFEVEAPPDPKGEIEYAPTLVAQTRDFHTLCIDIPVNLDSGARLEFVVACMTKCLPVKLFVAVPAGHPSTELHRYLRQARQLGVGVLEVNGDNVQVLHPATSLSLAGVHRVDPTRFPVRYRQALSTAESTFLNGNPSMGCLEIYEQIESLSRRLARRAIAVGCWTAPAKMNIDTDPWARLVKALSDSFDRKACGCPGLSKALLARVYGITQHRNESGHAPSSRATLTRRDRQMRTRFEAAQDLLLELIEAGRPLRP
jgi:hypothetical protein